MSVPLPIFKRVLIAHAVVILLFAVAPFLRSCSRPKPVHVLPVTLQFESTAQAAVTPPPTPVAPPPPPEKIAPAPPPEKVTPTPPPKKTVIKRGKRVQRSEVTPTPAPAPAKKLTPEEVRRALEQTQSAPPPASADTPHFGRVQRMMYQAWVKPVSAELYGRTVSVTLWFAPDGTVERYTLKDPSGVSDLDDSVVSAVQSVRRIDGLPSDFLKRHPVITVVFEVK